jgi:hypothetical protein
MYILKGLILYQSNHCCDAVTGVVCNKSNRFLFFSYLCCNHCVVRMNGLSDFLHVFSRKSGSGLKMIHFDREKSKSQKIFSQAFCCGFSWEIFLSEVEKSAHLLKEAETQRHSWIFKNFIKSNCLTGHSWSWDYNIKAS